MIGRTPAAAWGVLLGAAAVASFTPTVVQLGFAAIAIGVIGMAHGAGDLAVVAPRRRALFLLLYGLVSFACLVWWIACPAVALPLFLAASAVHFGVEDAPADRPVERLLRGVSLVTTPAAFHPAELDRLLRLAGGVAGSTMSMTSAYSIAGLLAGGLLLLIAAKRSDLRLFVGTTALLTFPPLIGFSMGFLILHALPQTAERQRQLGLPDTMSYVRAVAPILGTAVVIVVAIGAVLLGVDGTGVRSLFVGIAALAIPHLLVTPWFEPAGCARDSERITGAAYRLC